MGGKLRVGLIYGGRSGEHPISIRSARFVAKALDRSRFELVLIGIDPEGRWFLCGEEELSSGERVDGQPAREIVAVPGSRGTCRFIFPADSGRSAVDVDVLFPILHGPFGEDGSMQGVFEILGVPYVGSRVLGSAIGMDKDVHKRLLRDAGLPIVPFVVTLESEWSRAPHSVRERIEPLGSKVFVKPANLGSSLGISRVTAPEQLDAAVEEALRHDRKVVIERAVDAREIECAVLGNDEPRASLPGEIAPGEEFYSYEDKYSDKSTARLLVPAPLSAELTETVRSMAVEVFRVLELRGMARVDFFLERGTEELLVNEPNTLPGFTSISMYPRVWEASGLPNTELTTRLIELAMEERG